MEAGYQGLVIIYNHIKLCPPILPSKPHPAPKASVPIWTFYRNIPLLEDINELSKSAISLKTSNNPQIAMLFLANKVMKILYVIYGC